MRKKPKKPGRELVQYGVSQVLYVKEDTMIRHMQRQGITTPITVKDAKEWRKGTAEPPEWIASLMDAAEARRIERQERKDAAAEDAQIAYELEAEAVASKFEAGKRIRRDEWDTASDLALHAARELARACGEVDALSDGEVAALKWAGINLDDPNTWPFAPADPEG